MATLVRRFDADHEALSDARGEVNEWLRDHADTEVVDETTALALDVVMTELAANVIDHTASPWVRLVVKLRPRHLMVEVANEGDMRAVPEVEQWGVLEEGHRGRGLRLVRRLGDDVDIRGDDDTTVVRWRAALS